MRKNSLPRGEPHLFKAKSSKFTSVEKKILSLKLAAAEKKIDD